MAAVEPIEHREMMERAAGALGKVDLWGRRGLSMINTDEIEAMALTLATLGLVAVPPGAAMPETLILKPEEI